MSADRRRVIRATFIDPNPTLHAKCRCKPDCEMPCWQLYGLTEQSCGACKCPPFSEQMHDA